jgi:hypothetical protein
VDPWLQQAVEALGGGAELSAGDERALLELAKVAAHTSGARTNAPLVCYLVGRLQGDRPVAEAVEDVLRSTS